MGSTTCQSLAVPPVKWDVLRPPGLCVPTALGPGHSHKHSRQSPASRNARSSFWKHPVGEGLRGRSGHHRQAPATTVLVPVRWLFLLLLPMVLPLWRQAGDRTEKGNERLGESREVGTRWLVGAGGFACGPPGCRHVARPPPLASLPSTRPWTPAQLIVGGQRRDSDPPGPCSFSVPLAVPGECVRAGAGRALRVPPACAGRACRSFTRLLCSRQGQEDPA